MPPNPSGLLGRWSASPDIDDLLQSVEFCEDGSGTVKSGGGHGLCLCADFLWDLDAKGTVALRFQPTQRAPFPPYTPPEPGAVHAIRCALEVGEFPLRRPAVMGTVTYRRRLRFDDSPLPTDAAKYHAGNLFFSVVNQLDPRQFLVFYARAGASEVVPWPRPAPIEWRAVLQGAQEVRLFRLPDAANGDQRVRLVAEERFLLEGLLVGGRNGRLEEGVSRLEPGAP